MLNIEGNNATILVVDDDPTILKLLEKALGDNRYNVLLALDATTGLTIAAKQRPDLIILDIIMPDLSGFEVLKRLKDNPATKHIPVIMVTVKKLEDDIQRSLDLGAEDYISKPIHVKLLIRRMENILKKVLEE